MPETRRLLEVLLVEDDPGDVAMTQEAVDGSILPVRLTVVNNGEAAVDYLRRQGSYRGASRPDLVLLDLNLPRMSGKEVLGVVKADSGLAHVPVVVLSTSSSDTDISSSYGLGANAYVTKPLGYDAFVEAVRKIDEFFLDVAQPPPR